MDTFFKKTLILALTASLSFQSFAREDVSSWKEGEVHAIPDFSRFLKERHKTDSNEDIFEMHTVPVANATLGKLFMRSTNDRDFDGHSCRFLYESQNLPLAKGQTFKIDESGMLTKRVDGEKKLFIQLNFKEQDRYLDANNQIQYKEKQGGVSFSYTCFLTLNAVNSWGYSQFLYGMHGYMLNPSLRNAALARNAEASGKFWHE